MIKFNLFWKKIRIGCSFSVNKLKMNSFTFENVRYAKEKTYQSIEWMAVNAFADLFGVFWI